MQQKNKRKSIKIQIYGKKLTKKISCKIPQTKTENFIEKHQIGQKIHRKLADKKSIIDRKNPWKNNKLVKKIEHKMREKCNKKIKNK